MSAEFLFIGILLN